MLALVEEATWCEIEFIKLLQMLKASDYYCSIYIFSDSLAAMLRQRNGSSTSFNCETIVNSGHRCRITTIFKQKSSFVFSNGTGRIHGYYLYLPCSLSAITCTLENQQITSKNSFFWVSMKVTDLHGHDFSAKWKFNHEIEFILCLGDRRSW